MNSNWIQEQFHIYTCIISCIGIRGKKLKNFHPFLQLKMGLFLFFICCCYLLGLARKLHTLEFLIEKN